MDPTVRASRRAQMSRKHGSGATSAPSGSCHRAEIRRKSSLALDTFVPSSPNHPTLIQSAGIIVQPVAQTLFRQHRSISVDGDSRTFRFPPIAEIQSTQSPCPELTPAAPASRLSEVRLSDLQIDS